MNAATVNDQVYGDTLGVDSSTGLITDSGAMETSTGFFEFEAYNGDATDGWVDIQINGYIS
jgi:hypothetical protein